MTAIVQPSTSRPNGFQERPWTDRSHPTRQFAPPHRSAPVVRAPRARSKVGAGWANVLWPTRKPAVQYAEQQLRALKEHCAEIGEPLPGAADEGMRRILHAVSDARTVFPSISTDGEGALIAEWRWDRFVLELTVEADGADSVEVREIGKPARSLRGPADLRRRLVLVTAVVERKNPQWRKLFRTPGPDSRP